jgi:7,8-dihydropterin-6-yl-methyl-4-(beta-D-ribofuranosyl)aminobenzene 5'-phosphate synthase
MRKTRRFTALFLLIVIIGGTGVYFLRTNRARQQVQLDSQTPSVSLPAGQLGSTQSLSILPLYENSEAADGLIAGHGVSYLIRTDQANILVDAGNNPDRANPSPLIHNMRVLGIELDGVDTLVISHNHPDHTGGTMPWSKPAIAADGLQVRAVYVPVEMAFAGHVTQLADTPQILGPGVATLGRQPFKELFPMSLIHPLAYEQSLVVNVEGQGLVVITSCGHPTIERIVARAENLFGVPVIGVVGGLHYGMSPLAELQPHIDFLTERQPALVALSPHDSGPAVVQAFEAAFPAVYQHIQVGVEIVFP